MIHQRLGAMMPGADRDILFVQYGTEIVRVYPFQRKTDDALPGDIPSESAKSTASRSL